jgi:hypothetical protein
MLSGCNIPEKSIQIPRLVVRDAQLLEARNVQPVKGTFILYAFDRIDFALLGAVSVDAKMLCLLSRAGTQWRLFHHVFSANGRPQAARLH